MLHFMTRGGAQMVEGWGCGWSVVGGDCDGWRGRQGGTGEGARGRAHWARGG